MGLAIIELHKLIGVELHEREVMGERCKCISIPLKWNGIEVFKDKYIFGRMFITPKAPNNRNHESYLSVSFSKNLKDMYFRVRELGLWNQIRYIGYVYKNDLFKNPKPTHKVDIDDILEIGKKE